VTENGHTVLIVTIDRSENRPVRAKVQDGSKKAYVRIKDENIVASPVHLELWRKYALQNGSFIQFTERQRQIRDKTVALRNAYNKDFFTNMAKMQSEERLAENARAMQALRDAQAKAAAQKADDNTRKTDSQIDVNNSRIAYYNAQTGKIEMLLPEQIKEIESKIALNGQRGNAAASNAATAARRESRMAQSGGSSKGGKKGRGAFADRTGSGSGSKKGAFR
jgi:hypothetical protein